MTAIYIYNGISEIKQGGLLMLGNKIKSLRLEKGLSQESFAKELSVVRQTVSKWEKGLSTPDSDMIILIANVLDTTVSDLLCENVSEPSAPLQESAKKDSNIFSIILIILGFPVWFSLIVAAFAIALSLYVSIWAVIISLWAVFGSLIGAAFGGIISGIVFALGAKVPSGLVTIGAALVLAGLSIFMFYGCKSVTEYVVAFTKKSAKWFWGLIARKGAKND